MQLIFRVIQFSMCFRAFYTVLIKSQPLTTRSFPRHFYYGTCADYMSIWTTLT